MPDFASKGYAATLAMSRAVKLMSAAGIPISRTVPQEGATVSALTNMLVKDAPHPACAYLWMEYALAAKIQADSAAALGTNPFVAAACEGASDSLSAEDCERNGFSRFGEFSNLQFPTTDCGDAQNNCIPLDRWEQKFTALTNS